MADKEDKKPNVDNDDDEDSEEEIPQEEKDENLLEASKNNDIENVELWLDKGGDPTFMKEGWNSVLWAACNGNEELIHLLYRRKALTDYIGEPQRGEELPATEDEKAEEGDDRSNPFQKPLDARKVGRYTPLHWASYKGHLKIVWFLLKIGISPLRIDMYGNSSVHQAAASGNLDVLSCYLSKGVDVNMKNARGHTPLDLTTEEETKKLILRATKTLKCENKECPQRDIKFDFKNIRYYCEVSHKFYCKNCSVTMYVYNTHESEEKDRPVCRSKEVQNKIEHREAKLTEAVESYDFKEIDRELALCTGVDIDAKIRKQAEILHTKLEHELRIQTFLEAHRNHDNYKDIRKDVQRVNELLEHAQVHNIDIN